MAAFTVRAGTAVLLIALAALPACGDSAATSTDEQSYQIDQKVDVLAVDARAAAITVEAGDGPVTVTESFRYGKQRPTTAHNVANSTLTLTESGCGDDNVRCEVKYRIRVPAVTRTEITAKAGSVTLTGLAGAVQVTTEAGAVRGSGLAGPEVTVTSQAGATELVFAEPPTALEVRTELGAVSLDLPPQVAYAVTVATEVGRSQISVDQDPASKHRVEVHTQVGAVSIEPTP
ncbi:DUF4097 family beta strand repeat-containing protein [Actinoplanes sp. NBC_00393]|uniref:hypothetical protein n=1 Tax=Actinoplanes sp. NBC_00393 TaxID=2975953 RepID=UPI002E23E76C